MSPDIKHILVKHLELESFFAGDFSIRGCPRPSASMVPSTESEKMSPTVSRQPTLIATETTVPSLSSFQTLEDIAAAVRQCRLCGLAQTRTHAVPGQGNPKARLVFVGEGPGEDEDKQGLAFVGKAGKKLTEIIAAMGLNRQEVFICNVVKCRPPGNRDPKPDEIAQCMPYLKRQLELIAPTVIVALGAHAARTLLETDAAIGKLRGRFFEYRFSLSHPPAKLMPTYHPSYLIRNYTLETRRRVWEDMKKVMQELGIGPAKP
jgi:DNA polymerase